MTRGRIEFDEGYEAKIPIHVTGSGDLTEIVTAVIDTGFTGFLALPSEMITRLGLPPRNVTKVQVADGLVLELGSFDALVEFEGERFQIDVLQHAGDPLIGMSLLAGCRLSIHITAGGEVTVERG